MCQPKEESVKDCERVKIRADLGATHRESEKESATEVTIPPSLREPLAVSVSDFWPFLLPSQLDASKCETWPTMSRHLLPPFHTRRHTKKQCTDAFKDMHIE